MKRALSLLWLCAALCGLAIAASQPAGYYNAAQGKSGQSLLTALYGIIGSHTSISYSAVWTAYKTTDCDADGYIIDMYSNVRYKYGVKQGTSYSKIGDSYNREHSFPQSWFNDASPMKTDLFHVIPTDGYVNNQRGNYPFGECESGTRLTNGSYQAKGKLGTCTTQGYTGKVWEPDDEYKGDFARIYFYMATCYNNRIATWSSNSTEAAAVLAGNSYPAYQDWYIAMLLKWDREDPVSDRERERNNAVYDIQKNRNPYVDHPELVEYVWGNKVGTPWQENADTTTTPTDTTTIITPTALPAIDSTSTSLTAAWTTAKGAESYTLHIEAVDTTTTKPGTVTLLLDEDMSGGTTTWTLGGNTYKDKGYLRLGTGSGNGNVTSPAIDLSQSDGVATVAVTAKPYGSDTDVPMQVSLVNSSGTELASTTVTLSKNETTYTAVLKGNASSDNRVKIAGTTTRKRVLLKQVKVYSGDAGNAVQAPRETAVETGDSTTRTITGITDTTYTVTALKRGGTYDYKVKAVYASGSESGWSNAIRTQLPSATTTTLMGDVNGSGIVDVTDVTTLINKILGQKPSPFIESNADLDGNGNYDVTDVTAIINIILSAK